MVTTPMVGCSSSDPGGLDSDFALGTPPRYGPDADRSCGVMECPCYWNLTDPVFGVSDNDVQDLGSGYWSMADRVALAAPVQFKSRLDMECCDSGLALGCPVPDCCERRAEVGDEVAEPVGT